MHLGIALASLTLRLVCTRFLDYGQPKSAAFEEGYCVSAAVMPVLLLSSVVMTSRLIVQRR